MEVTTFKVWVEGKEMKIASEVRSYPVGGPSVCQKASFYNGPILDDAALADRIVKEMQFLTHSLWS